MTSPNTSLSRDSSSTSQITFRCPLCHLDLETNASSYTCDNRHCFDIAKEGYVNLLPVQNKKSKAPGDSAEMIQARRRFLDAGYYSGFANYLESLIAETLAPRSILDIGSGEGYYTEKLSKRFTEAKIAGIDISKTAVKMCAKKNRRANFAVASAVDLPFTDNQFDLTLSIFSPIDLQEAERVMKAGATLLFVGPGPTHLRSLAEHIYDKTQEHKGNPQQTNSSALSLISSKRYQSTACVNGEHVPDLLLMTPYYWHCSEESKLKLQSLNKLEIELDFQVNIYKKTA